MMLRRLVLLLGSLAALAAAAPRSDGPMPLKDVKTWMYQFQEIESRGAIAALAQSPYDLLVVEPTGTYRQARDFDMKSMVDRLHGGRAGRIVLAYLNVAEADENRIYWEKGWRTPDKDRRGSPDFLVKPDPDGWKETHVVAFGDPRWQKLVLADVRTVMAAGFDGLWLDWVEGYADSTLAADLRAQGRDPARTMVDLLARVREEAGKSNPKALLAIQNAPYLLDEDPRLATLVDALGAEATWYGGKAEVGWTDERGGDRPNPAPSGRASSGARIAQYARWRASSKPVFTLDYCLSADHAKEVYERSVELGFVPLVSRSALDRITQTPPPGLR